MRLSLVFFSLLCVATWMTVVDANFGPVNTCCLKLTQKRISPKKVVDYIVQTTALCPIKVIVLHTIKRKRICGDPESDWVRKAMEKVDETKAIKREEEEEEEEGKEGKTVTKAPAVPCKQGKGEKKGGKKGKGKGGKRGGKREGRGRKRTGVTNQLSN